MTHVPPSRRARIWPIDRFSGMARQFRWTGADTGYVFRRDGTGAAIPVTDAERAGYLRSGRWSLLVHAIVLGLVVWAALLASQYFYPAAPTTARAASVALIASCVGLVLYRSHGWYVDAPARTLADRAPVAPAEEIDVTRWPSYGTIAATVLGVIIAILLHYRSTAVSIVGVSVAAIVVGMGVAAMKWWFERGFTPRQRERAAAHRAVPRPIAGRPMGWWQVVLLFLFVVLEMIVGLIAFVLPMMTVIGASGTNIDDPAPIPFIGGMVLGFVCLFFALWPLEKLCKRWTGTSTQDAFGGFI